MGLSLVILICTPFLSANVYADWSSDTWLSNIIGPERLENGDEFGCHGYEGVDTSVEPWAISACKEYLLEQTNASRWGKNPISFGFPPGKIDDLISSELIELGFFIVGDLLTEKSDGLFYVNRNGASLEKGVADIELLRSAEQDSLVSIHWRARVDDLRVRDDSEVVSWLGDQDVWFTTWGEWYFHRLSGIGTGVSLSGSKIFINSSIQNNTSQGHWQVPGTTKVMFTGNIVSIYDQSGTTFPELNENVRKLQVGWREIEDGILVTQNPGTSLIIEIENESSDMQSFPIQTFNNLHHSVTIVGHHTTNLFRWTQDFQNSELVFTWLIERPENEGIGIFIPGIAIAVLIAVPAIMAYLIRRDKNAKIQSV
tara:strand:- start:96 stop:1202 length:1107 start_codon:yes stop_codon:yes gene_type:complete